MTSHNSKHSSSKLERQDFEFGINEHIRWGEMDAFQHLNNTVYFRLFESVRIKFFERIRFSDPKTLNYIGPTLAYTDCQFKKPLFYPCELWVATRARDLKEDRFKMDYAVFAGSDTRPAAVGTGKIVCYHYQQQCKAPIPDSVLIELKPLAINH